MQRQISSFFTRNNDPESNRCLAIAIAISGLAWYGCFLESHVASRVAVVVFLFHWVIHSRTGSDKYTLNLKPVLTLKRETGIERKLTGQSLT